MACCVQSDRFTSVTLMKYDFFINVSNSFLLSWLRTNFIPFAVVSVDKPGTRCNGCSGFIHGNEQTTEVQRQSLPHEGTGAKLRRERNVLFNDALNTFYLRLYGVRHMVKDHSDSEKGNPLPPHRLLLSINSKGSFICTIPQTG